MSQGAMPGGVQMLPLIVGAIEDASGADIPVTAATHGTIEDAELIADSEKSDTSIPKESVIETEAVKD